jgi:hypothetical protein
MRLDTAKRRQASEIHLPQEAWFNEIARASGAPTLPDDIQRLQPTHPRAYRIYPRKRERQGQLAGCERVMLSQETQGNPFPLSQLEEFIRSGDEVNHFWSNNPAPDDHLNPVGSFPQFRDRPSLRKEHLVNPVKSATLALHELEVMEHPCQLLVAAD